MKQEQYRNQEKALVEQYQNDIVALTVKLAEHEDKLDQAKEQVKTYL